MDVPSLSRRHGGCESVGVGHVAQGRQYRRRGERVPPSLPRGDTLGGLCSVQMPPRLCGLDRQRPGDPGGAFLAVDCDGGATPVDRLGISERIAEPFRRSEPRVDGFGQYRTPASRGRWAEALGDYGHRQKGER